MRLSPWWMGLTLRERVTIVIALGLITVSLALTRLAPAWREWSESEQRRLTALTDTLSQMREATSTQGERVDSIRLQRLRSALARVTPLIARTEEEAALAAMNLVVAAADDVGIEFSSIQRYRESGAPTRGKSKRRDSFQAVNVKATGITDPNLMPELLAFLDTSRVQLAARSMSISAAVSGGGQRAHEVRFELVVAAAAQLQPAHGAPGR